MSKTNQPHEFKIGDLVAWESQAQGSWKTKIGRITRLPISDDARTSLWKFEIQVVAAYSISNNADIGNARNLISTRWERFGRANRSSLRVLTAAEQKAVA